MIQRAVTRYWFEDCLRFCFEIVIANNAQESLSINTYGDNSRYYLRIVFNDILKIVFLSASNESKNFSGILSINTYGDNPLENTYTRVKPDMTIKDPTDTSTGYYTGITMKYIILHT